MWAVCLTVNCALGPLYLVSCGRARQDYKLSSREKLDQLRERPATSEIKIS